MTLAELFGEQPKKKNVVEALVESKVAALAAKRLIKTIKKGQ